jgi:hypothetical protein
LHRREFERRTDLGGPDFVGAVGDWRRSRSLLKLRLTNGHLTTAFSHRSYMHVSEALEVTAVEGPDGGFDAPERHAGRSMSEVANSRPLVASTATLSDESQP